MSQDVTCQVARPNSMAIQACLKACEDGQGVDNVCFEGLASSIQDLCNSETCATLLREYIGCKIILLLRLDGFKLPTSG